MTRQSWIQTGVQTAAILATILIVIFTNVATKGDIRRIEGRLDKIETRLDTVVQNQIEHLTRLHAQRRQPNQNSP